MSSKKKYCPKCDAELTEDYYVQMRLRFWDCYECDRCFQERNGKLLEVSNFH
jgi:transposase-like protein